jgi:hypothetical protein
MNFNETPEFTKDVKRLAKKWRSLPDDIKAVKQYIRPLYEKLADDVEVAEYRREFFAAKTATVLHANDSVEVIKMRLDVASLGRSDKVRVIFIALRMDSTITFIELYAKNDKPREDKARYLRYIK